VVYCVLTNASPKRQFTRLDRRVATVCTDVTVSVQTKLELTKCKRTTVKMQAAMCHRLSHTQLMLARQEYDSNKPQGQHRHDHALLKNKTEEKACQ